MDRITHEDLMRYLDDELSSGERARVDAELARSTELQRELSLFEAMSRDFQELSFAPAGDGSVWDQVSRRLTRRIGWMLVCLGVAAWSAYGAWLFLTSPVGLAGKLADAALIIGLLLLLASVVHERYREWLTDPYRDVQR